METGAKESLKRLLLRFPFLRRYSPWRCYCGHMRDVARVNDYAYHYELVTMPCSKCGAEGQSNYIAKPRL